MEDDKLISFVTGCIRGALNALCKIIPFGNVAILVGLPDGRVVYGSSEDTEGLNYLLNTALSKTMTAPTHEGTDTLQ